MGDERDKIYVYHQCMVQLMNYSSNIFTFLLIQAGVGSVFPLNAQLLLGNQGGISYSVLTSVPFNLCF